MLLVLALKISLISDRLISGYVSNRHSQIQGQYIRYSFLKWFILSGARRQFLILSGSGVRWFEGSGMGLTYFHV
jgi:hypothetical protein